jgi:hypothetical protein
MICLLNQIKPHSLGCAICQGILAFYEARLDSPELMLGSDMSRRST